MKYRPEVDGLRALAVVPVMLFHAGLELFSGGFVGVDIFFVISGYLITTIIINELDQGKFSIVNFYERRARRILPALTVVILATIPFAFLWLMPRDMQNFVESIIAVALFSSNILFWQESGYFDTASELKPLLHTWSLAVEEQYYIFFPLLLMAFWRFGRTVVVTLLIAGFFASLALAEYLVLSKPSAAFFLLPTRGWELLIGAGVAFYLQKRTVQFNQSVQNSLSLAGFAMVSVSLFIYTGKTPFPSLYALLPTIGSALIILYANKGTVVNRLLSLKPMVGIGLISYSAYLWHQPILAFAKYKSIGHLDVVLGLLLILASTLLAWLTWYYVETPFRVKGKMNRATIFKYSGTTLAGMLLFGAVVSTNVLGTNNFMRADLYTTTDRELLLSETQFAKLGAEEEKALPVVIWGDSYADALTYELGERLNAAGRQMYGYIKHSCPSLVNVLRNEEARMGQGFQATCVSHNEDVLAKLMALAKQPNRPRYVVLTASYSWYVSGKNWDGESILLDEANPEIPQQQHVPSNLVKTVNTLADLGYTSIVILPHPVVKNFEGILRTDGYKPDNIIAETNTARQDGQLLLQALQQGAAGKFVAIEPVETLCGNDTCKVFNDDLQQPFVWYDGTHLSRYGAAKIVEQVLRLIPQQHATAATPAGK